MQAPKYGLLLNNDIKLHRGYFDEMIRLLGIQVIYRAPLADKHYTTYAEIESNYAEPILVGCIWSGILVLLSWIKFCKCDFK